MPNIENSRIRIPELLAPAGDLASLHAAIDAGCNAVYFGIRSGFNMRVGARNFAVSDLPRLTRLCHQAQVKAYLAVNTLVYESELNKLERLMGKAAEAGVDAVIAWDHAVIQAASQRKIPIHLSTQASTANSATIRFYYETLGIRRFVIARECSLTHIRRICKNLGDLASQIELECFAHGALCVSLSGRCYLSHHAYNASGNRGACLQPCRRRFRIVEIDGDSEFEMGEHHILSPKDLCTLPFLDQLIRAGIRSLKIEGRNRSADYVHTVTAVYRRTLDQLQEIYGRKNWREQFSTLIKEGLEQLDRKYHRGFSNGFYLGLPNVEDWSENEGNLSSEVKVFLGEVVNYFARPSVAAIRIRTQPLQRHAKVLIIGPTTGACELTVERIEVDNKVIAEAPPGTVAGIKTPRRVRRGDKAYLLLPRNQKKRPNLK
ncbi:MAG: U32 family peptidase [Lentisphaerae bacterium]|nr:MAG: U32 family peptidase [Lentisphaerota bacterium]